MSDGSERSERPEGRAREGHDEVRARPHLRVRGLYGGVPEALLQKGKTLADYGINAVWLGTGALTKESIQWLRRQNASVYAEFNTMHHAPFLEGHPDAAPVGPGDSGDAQGGASVA